MGDSKRPLYYLCISSAVNIVLDLVFVLVFHMGISGVGYATVIAQAVSAVLAFFALVRTKDSYRVELKRIAIDKRMMKRILAIGIPSGIQHSIISLSNVIVQANINVYGSAAMAGYGAYSKIDGFVDASTSEFLYCSHYVYRTKYRSRKQKEGEAGNHSGNYYQRSIYAGSQPAAVLESFGFAADFQQ